MVLITFTSRWMNGMLVNMRCWDDIRDGTHRLDRETWNYPGHVFAACPNTLIIIQCKVRRDSTLSVSKMRYLGENFTLEFWHLWDFQLRISILKQSPKRALYREVSLIFDDSNAFFHDSRTKSCVTYSQESFGVHGKCR